MKFKSTRPDIVVLFVSAMLTSGCAGTIIETATDAAVAVAKVPFEVGGAVVDVVAGEEEEREEKQE